MEEVNSDEQNTEPFDITLTVPKEAPSWTKYLTSTKGTTQYPRLPEHTQGLQSEKQRNTTENEPLRIQYEYALTVVLAVIHNSEFYRKLLLRCLSGNLVLG